MFIYWRPPPLTIINFTKISQISFSPPDYRREKGTPPDEKGHGSYTVARFLRELSKIVVVSSRSINTGER
jgi:hypothetical protein